MLRQLMLWLMLLTGGFAFGQGFTVRVSQTGSGCEYGTVRYDATISGGSGVCRWYKIGGLRDKPVGSGNLYTISSVRPWDAGDYYCIVTDPDSGAEVYSDTLSLNVTRLIVRLPELVGVNSQESFSLTALNEDGNAITGSKIIWRPDGVPGNPRQFVAGNSDLKLRVEYHEGACMGVDSITVKVRKGMFYHGGEEDGFSRVSSAFRIESEIQVRREYCAGETVPFKVMAFSEGGSGVFTYRWFHVGGGGNLAVSERDSFALSPAKAIDNGDYFCEVKDADGTTVVSDTFHLIYRPLKINVQPEIIYADESEEVKLAAFRTEGDTILMDSLQWYERTVNGVFQMDSERPEGNRFVYVAGTTDAYIKAVYTNYKGCTAEDSTLIVTKPARLSFGGPEDGFSKVGAGFTVERLSPKSNIQEYCAGTPMGFKASVVGENNDNYRFYWWKAEQPTNRLIAERDTFNIENLTFSDAGGYFCEARDVNGASAYTDTLLLVLHEVNLPQSLYATPGERVSLLAENVKGESITTSLVWSVKEDGDADYSPISSTDNPLNYAIGSSPMTIRVLSTFTGGCMATDSTAIYIRNNNVFVGGTDDGYDFSGVAPQLVRPFLPEMLCSAYDSVTLQVAAEGTDLSYRWQYLAGKQWKDVTSNGFTATGINSSVLTLDNLPVEYRSTLRCMVWNDVDTVYSAGTYLTGHHLLEIKVDPETVRLVTENSATVTVSLEKGVKPWTYRYETPRGVKRDRIDLTLTEDLFTVSDVGLYNIIYLCDSLGCVIEEGLPVVTVTDNKIPEVEISGGGEVCRGSQTSLQLLVTDGVGPWEIIIYRDGVEADDLGITWPLKLEESERQYAIWFSALQGGTYTVGSVVDLNEGGTQLTGTKKGSATVTLKEASTVNFAILSDNHVGICRNINLLTKLLPSIDGVLAVDGDGSFFMDGAPQTTVWSPTVGTHAVKYLQAENEFGCAGSAEVLLVVDQLPTAVMDLPREVCDNDTASLLVTTVGSGVRFLLQQQRVNRNLSVMESEVTVGVSPVYRQALKFLSEDSCIIYTVDKVTDVHGCEWTGGAQEATIVNHLKPQIRLEKQYPQGEEWDAVSDTIWTVGDNVLVKGTPTQGVSPFTVRSAKGDVDVPTEIVNTNGSVFKEAGTYHFSVEDKFCMNKEAGQLVIEHTEPLYVRMKVLLENDGEDLAGAEGSLSLDLCTESGEIVASAPCFVSTDGNVKDNNGNSTIKITGSLLRPGQSYYLVVTSAGYLPVKSHTTYALSTEETEATLIDFTNGRNIYNTSGVLSHHMTSLMNNDGRDVWALSRVDGNENVLISVKDENKIKGEKLRAGNADGVALQEDATRKNRDKYSEVELH